MVKTIYLDDMFGILTLIMEQRYREDLNRYRSLHIYRGMPNADYKLVPSLHRVCKKKRYTLEPTILANFTKYAMLEDPSIETSVWRQMVLGQHHGLPTRLLDWSFSPLVGLHFSTIEGSWDDMEAHDSVVWRLDVDELHEMLPEKYQKVMQRSKTTVFSLRMLQEACADAYEYDADMGGKAMVVVEPPSIEQRIVNQYSFFSIVPLDCADVGEFLEKNTEKTVKYIIKKELRWRVRDLLDQLNVSERIIYPGLDGLSSWLARHYYVKD